MHVKRYVSLFLCMALVSCGPPSDRSREGNTTFGDHAGKPQPPREETTSGGEVSPPATAGVPVTPPTPEVTPAPAPETQIPANQQGEATPPQTEPVQTETPSPLLTTGEEDATIPEYKIPEDIRQRLRQLHPEFELPEESLEYEVYNQHLRIQVKKKKITFTAVLRVQGQKDEAIELACNFNPSASPWMCNDMFPTDVNVAKQKRLQATFKCLDPYSCKIEALQLWAVINGKTQPPKLFQAEEFEIRRALPEPKEVYDIPQDEKKVVTLPQFPIEWELPEIPKFESKPTPKPAPQQQQVESQPHAPSKPGPQKPTEPQAELPPQAPPPREPEPERQVVEIPPSQPEPQPEPEKESVTPPQPAPSESAPAPAPAVAPSAPPPAAQKPEVSSKPKPAPAPAPAPAPKVVPPPPQATGPSQVPSVPPPQAAPKQTSREMLALLNDPKATLEVRAPMSMPKPRASEYSVPGVETIPIPTEINSGSPVQAVGCHNCSGAHLKNSDQFPPNGPGYVSRSRGTGKDFGTFLTVDLLGKAFELLARAFPNRPRIWLLNVANKTGGKLSGQDSHRTGLDADIGFPGIANERGDSGANMDRERMWHFMKQLACAENKAVMALLMDESIKQKMCRYVQTEVKEDISDPKSCGFRALQMTRHWAGHLSHMHVRLRCPENSHCQNTWVPLSSGTGCSGSR